MSIWRRDKHKDLQAELKSHLEMAARDKADRGLSDRDARHAARREFGNVELVTQTTREAWGWTWLRDLFEDARFGWRTLGKSAGFTLTAVLTLALGIGANTAIFSLIDAALLKSLPVRGADRLVIPLWHAHQEPKHWSVTSYGDCQEQHNPKNPGGCSFSNQFFDELRSRKDVFSSVAAFASGEQMNLSGNGPADTVRLPEYVSGQYFETLGIVPAAGRLITEADDTPTAPPVIVLGYNYWRSKFGGASSAIGKTVLLNKVPFTVVGVAEPQFDSLSPGNMIDLWLPLSSVPRLELPWDGRDVNPQYWWLVVVGRLNPGVQREQAQAAANTIFANQTQNIPKPLFKAEDAAAIALNPINGGLSGDRIRMSKPLYVLLLAVGIVLLIACANVAGLLLSRATARQREIAVRFALGASRGRLLRQLLTESLMLALSGGALGILFAWWCLHSITAFLAADASDGPLPFTPELDVRVLLFTAACAVLTGIVFGLAPALRSVRVDLTPALKQGMRTGNVGQRRGGSRLSAGSALVIAQVALSIVVLAGAGLLVRTLQNLKNVDTGFDTRNLLTFRLDPSLAGYSPDRATRFFADLQSRLNALPGVYAATYSWRPLLGGGLWITDFHLPGRPKDELSEADALPVGVDFFQTMRIPILDGRDFTAADLDRAQSEEAHQAAQRAAAVARRNSGNKPDSGPEKSAGGPPIPVIVNTAFVRKYFPNVNPLSQRFGQADADPEKDRIARPGWEIVGVAADAKYNNLRRAVEPTIYMPNNRAAAAFTLRTASDPALLIQPVRSVIGSMDSNLPMFRVFTESQQIDRQVFQERLIARLSGFFAVLALVLACIGLYGLISYEVTQRTREIGIRAAMGAARSDVLGMVLFQGMRLALAGALLGSVLALILLRYAQSLLFGVTSSDPLTFVAVSALLIGVMLAASYVPARRAMSVDPIVALRYE